MKYNFQESEYGLINNEFQKSYLIDLCDNGGIQTGPFGSQLHQEDYVSEGTPIITVEHLGDFGIIHNNIPLVSDKDKERLKKYQLKEYDIVFSRVGSVDRCVLTSLKETGWLFSGRCLRVRPNHKRIVPEYLLYFFKQPNFKEYIRRIAVGATMPSINTKILSEVPIYYPSIDVQVEIANILKSIDSKINNNLLINQTLETIAQTLFKSWFVDFDPVKAKIAAKEQGEDPQLAAMMAISGKTADEIQQMPADKRKELADTADLFPDEMMESELGWIPKGWKVETLSSVTTQIKRGITPKYIEEGGVVVLNQKCVRNHTLNFEFARRHNDKLKSINDTCIEIGDILVNSTGVGTLGRVAIVRRLPEKTIIDTHVTVVRADEQKINKTYLGINLLGREIEIESLAEGTTGQTELKRSLLGELSVIIPERTLQEVFAQILNPQLKLYAKNEKENGSLVQIRDSLLPKLLSGEIAIN